MSKTAKKNMVGLKFGLLTVISEQKERNKNGHIMYNVVCDCGKSKSVLGSSLRRGGSKSCNNCILLTGGHRMWKSREFKIWGSMKSRCSNSNDPNYKYYGLRGIKVCERWINSFENFYLDMGKSSGLSIDRIDVNGNYEPINCRWTDLKTQARNRTNNKLYTYLNETLCVSEWCERLNMPSSTFHNRIIRGWGIEKIITTPIRLKSK
jgi:hypothetical protein